MSEISQSVRFCDGCPMANGVNKISSTFQCDWFLDKTLVISFQDGNHVSKPVSFTNGFQYVDSGMAQEAYFAVRTMIDGCEGPVDRPNPSFFGRFIGRTTVRACSAFPVENQDRHGAWL